LFWPKNITKIIYIFSPLCEQRNEENTMVEIKMNLPYSMRNGLCY